MPSLLENLNLEDFRVSLESSLWEELNFPLLEKGILEEFMDSLENGILEEFVDSQNQLSEGI